MNNTFVHIVDVPERLANDSYVAQAQVFQVFRNAVMAQESLADVISLQEKVLLPPPATPNWSRATRFEVRFPGGLLQQAKMQNAIDATRSTLGLQPVRWSYEQRIEEVR